jgi:hypothetical protein
MEVRCSQNPEAGLSFQPLPHHSLGWGARPGFFSLQLIAKAQAWRFRCAQLRRIEAE